MIKRALLIMALISFSASADSIKMWRDADGKLHFGDVPPPGAGSRDVVVSPENRTGVYGKENQLLRGTEGDLEAFRTRSYSSRTTTPESAGLDYEDEHRLRHLELQKKDVQDRMKNNRISVGDAIVYDEEIRGINRQIQSIHRKANRPQQTTGLDYEDERRLRQLELQKKDINDRMKNRRLTVGEGIVLDDEMEGINRQIQDIEDRR